MRKEIRAELDSADRIVRNPDECKHMPDMMVPQNFNVLVYPKDQH